MKLAPIKREHIIQAGELIDLNGIPNDSLSNNYWVELPNGNEYPFKHLVRTAYQLTEGNENSYVDFQSNEVYRGYIEKVLLFPVKNFKEGVNFFSKEDITHFEKIGGKKYRRDNEEDVKAAQLLKPLVKKLNVWAKNTLIENFEHRIDQHWQWSGTFKPYLWIRLYRSDSSKKVFFIVGATSNGGLYMSLDCLRSNYTNSGVLTLETQKMFDDYLKKSNYNEVFISKDDLQNLNWDKLVEKTTRFLYKYASVYDELEDLISPNWVVKNNTNRFELVEAPNKTKSYVNRKRIFKGHNTDWSQKQTISKLLGDAGEELVIEMEKSKLKEVNLLDKVDLVTKVKDGNGYDILSFNNKGEEIQIEVKTTTGSVDEPFYFSINEKEFLEQNSKNYFLYRLHLFQFNPNRAKYYILSAEDFLEKADFNPINYEVSINK